MSIQVNRSVVGSQPKVVDSEIETSRITAKIEKRKPKRRSKLFGLLDEFTDATDLSSQLVSQAREDDGRK